MTGEADRTVNLTDKLPDGVKRQINDLTDVINDKIPYAAGAYLHGSICLGGYVGGASDIDVLVVSDAPMSKAEREAFADAILPLHRRPAHIELSVVSRHDAARLPVMCRFHFSEQWAERYAAHDAGNPLLSSDFPDDDIPAYIKLIRQCGIVLFGEPPAVVLPDIPDEVFFRAITFDLGDFSFDSYGLFYSNVLTLARVASFAYTRRIMTKTEGARWGMEQYPRFAGLLASAAAGYEKKAEPDLDPAELEAYRVFMLGEINAGLR